MEKACIRERINSALGKENIDLTIVNAKILSVFTDEVLPERIVCVKNGKIIYTGEPVKKLLDKSKSVLDAEGKVVAPAFVEAHTHIAQAFRLCDFVKVSLENGVCTVITECGELGNSAGAEGIKEFLKDCEIQPAKIFVVLPPLTPPFPEFESSKGISFDEYVELLNHPLVLGLGEFYWTRILNLKEFHEKLIEYTLKLGKTVHGHSAGAKGEKLNAYFSMWIKSCHEPITVEEVIERIRLGVHVVLREGSVRCDFSNVFKFRELVKDTRMVSISTDGVTPCWLIEKGTLLPIARKAIKFGFSPVEIVKMLSVNAASVYNLQDRIGAIAPGRDADMIIFEDFEKFRIDKVISNGKVVVENGEATYTPKPYTYSKRLKNTLKLRKFSPSDFLYRSAGSKVKVRAVKYLDFLLTDMEEVELKVVDGNIVSSPEKGILKFCKIDIHGSNRIIKGFIKDLGLKTITYCSNINWEAYQLTVIGSKEEDMALAVNRLRELQGGIVIVKDGKVLEEVAMPVGGVMSEMPLLELSEKEKKITSILIEDGIRMKNPFIWIQTLSFTGLPYFKLTDLGLVDIKNQKFVDIIA